MAQIETTQVTLRLVEPNDMIATVDGEVEGKDVLKAMKNNRIWKTDKRGQYASIMFDGQEFKFYEKKFNSGKPFTRTVGPSIANALLRMSGVIVGLDKLTGPLAPYLIKVGVRELGEGDARPVVSPTTCPICFTDMKTLGRLARHISKHKKDHPELYDANDDSELDDEPVNDRIAAEPDGADDAADSGAESQDGD